MKISSKVIIYALSAKNRVPLCNMLLNDYTWAAPFQTNEDVPALYREWLAFTFGGFADWYTV